MAKKKQQILKDHKRMGSKFVPPLLQLKGFKEVSYINQILPEIIWMGLINDLVGYKKGVELIAQIAKDAFKLKSTEKYINFALVSNYKLLTNRSKLLLKKQLKASKTLSVIQEALAPLIKLYPSFPLAFLKEKGINEDRKKLILKIKTCTQRHFNKYDTPGLIIQANVLYIRGVTGGLYFNQKIQVPDLDTLIASPESEEAKRAGAFVRSSVLTEFMPIGEKFTGQWSSFFWNYGYKLDSCSFK